MKHFLLALGFGLLLYGFWHLSSPLSRKMGSRLLERHGLRLFAFLLFLLSLLAVAYYLPSLRLL